MRVPTRAGRHRYPDALVTCTPQRPDATEVTDPVVIFEILSSSTSGDDRTTKLTEYQAVPSIQRYVMLEQDRAFATVIKRSDSGWELTLVGPDGMLAMPEIAADIPLAELYAGLTFPTEASEKA